MRRLLIFYVFAIIAALPFPSPKSGLELYSSFPALPMHNLLLLGVTPNPFRRQTGLTFCSDVL